MQVLTNHFDLDKKTMVINCNARKTSKRGYRRKVVLISEAHSRRTNTYKTEVEDNVNFRTEFFLYRSEKEYLLQIVGTSNRPIDFPPKYKVILFGSPKMFLDIIEDDTNHDVFLSDPVLELIDGVHKSKYLSNWEKEQWDEAFIDSE